VLGAIPLTPHDLGFLAFTMDHVEIIMPAKTPRGLALTRAQKASNWFLLTPIIYPVSSVPERFRVLLSLKLITPFFVAYEEALLYNSLVS
jgi:hypothetical protein